ncbi:heptosyltransferase, partial [Desulfovibrio oxamicus]|nr:heptosyltransferase [Nitratidesulfovibrio oxamicus]
MAKHLVIQLARFGDLVQTKRLILSLLNGEGTDGGGTHGAGQGTGHSIASAPEVYLPEVHLAVDATLAELARLVYPGVIVHGVRAHGGVPQEDVLAHNARAFAALAAEGFDTVYNLNNSGLNMALAALFPPDIVRGYRSLNGQPLRDRWMRMAFRWVAHRRLSPVNLVDFWAALAPRPIAPARVNPIALRGGRGIGVVLAGRMSRRSLPPDA